MTVEIYTHDHGTDVESRMIFETDYIPEVKRLFYSNIIELDKLLGNEPDRKIFGAIQANKIQGFLIRVDALRTGNYEQYDIVRGMITVKDRGSVVLKMDNFIS